MTPFEPRLLALLCRSCANEAADAAGRRRLALPPGLRAVRVPCSGRVAPGHLLAALRAGADGVLVLGCHPGECHHGDGNAHARHRVELLRHTLAAAGVAPDRVAFGWVSAREAEGYAAATWALARTIGGLGPLPRVGAEASP